MKITLADGTTRSYDQPLAAAQIVAEMATDPATTPVAVKIDGRLSDLDATIDRDCHLSVVRRPAPGAAPSSGQEQADALWLLRHSTAHVMAEAVCQLWPQAQLAYGPPLENGFYYDISLPTPIRAEDFARIEREMTRIIAEDRPLTRYDLPEVQAMAKLEREGNKYKIDNARRALADKAATLSWYITGPAGSDCWEDLCVGPHLPSTGLIGACKVMSVAASHWHGDVHSDRFQRVYGTAFFHQADLDAHLERLEEARHRDHRLVGQKLELFAIDEQVGQGLVLWKPRGAVVRQQLQDFILDHLQRQGYEQVFTPHIGRLELYKTSGHYPYYQQSQYPPLISAEQIDTLAGEGASCGELANRMRSGEIDGYLLKPMNCPHHIRIYASQKRSYRDLPVRLAEFGTVYRWEQSGELGGLIRVRGFTQDDAHLFCTEEQLGTELAGCLELVRIIFKTLRMTDYRVRVGLRDAEQSKYVGEPAHWEKAERACREAAETLGVPFSLEPGEAAFYGPKIDFVVQDVLLRQWQLGTVQVDYNLPERFDLSYVGSDNRPHRPVMIHRAPFGSMERFIGVLIEHFGGAFPLWLAPEQVRVMPVSDKFVAYGQTVLARLKQGALRATLDESNERLGAKIKVGQDLKVPYMLIVGARDQKAGTVSVRCLKRGDLGAAPVDAFVDLVGRERDSFGQTQVAL